MWIQVFHTEFIWAAHPENLLMFVFIYKIMFFLFKSRDGRWSCGRVRSVSRRWFNQTSLQNHVSQVLIPAPHKDKSQSRRISFVFVRHETRLKCFIFSYICLLCCIILFLLYKSRVMRSVTDSTSVLYFDQR